MNSNEELYERLLEAFPVDLLRDYFELPGKKEEVIAKIVNNHIISDIDNFIYGHYGHLHQHIYNRELSKTIDTSKKDIIHGKLLNHKHTSTKGEWIYLHKTRYQYWDTKSSTYEYLEFLIPVKIKIKGKTMSVSYNTLSRDIKVYFQHTIFPTKSPDIAEDVIGDFKNNYSGVVFLLDLNKGIKYLWENDYLDGMVVQNRKAKSIRRDRMDENFLYKVAYPKDWDNLMLTPIQKTRFKVLKEIDMEHFECNPTTGYLNIGLFSQDADTIDDLLNLILKYN